ncbi:hypothetical protein [Paraburkholderia sp. MM5477-R1]|uniref:hypothetical protein n=1 Tax=Paraburkholderia sp. MM5477-R1 TaxID=2991062 RepID=UPI003D1D4857
MLGRICFYSLSVFCAVHAYAEDRLIFTATHIEYLGKRNDNTTFITCDLRTIPIGNGIIKPTEETCKSDDPQLNVGGLFAKTEGKPISVIDPVKVKSVDVKNYTLVGTDADNRTVKLEYPRKEASPNSVELTDIKAGDKLKVVIFKTSEQKFPWTPLLVTPASEVSRQ